MLSFSGSHRSGKSTTAQIVAQKLGLEFFDGSFGKLAAELGYNSVDALSIEDRLTMQERCLALHVAKITAMGRPVITDRSPLDFAAYCLAEIGMHSGINVGASRRAWAYAENCIEVTRRHYGAVAILRPLPTYTEEAGKPGPCLAFQTHIQLLIEGAAMRIHNDIALFHITPFDLEYRVTAAAGFFSQVVMNLGTRAKDELVH